MRSRQIKGQKKENRLEARVPHFWLSTAISASLVSRSWTVLAVSLPDANNHWPARVLLSHSLLLSHPSAFLPETRTFLFFVLFLPRSLVETLFVLALGPAL